MLHTGIHTGIRTPTHSHDSQRAEINLRRLIHKCNSAISAASLLAENSDDELNRDDVKHRLNDAQKRPMDAHVSSYAATGKENVDEGVGTGAGMRRGSSGGLDELVHFEKTKYETTLAYMRTLLAIIESHHHSQSTDNTPTDSTKHPPSPPKSSYRAGLRRQKRTTPEKILDYRNQIERFADFIHGGKGEEGNARAEEEEKEPRSEGRRGGDDAGGIDGLIETKVKGIGRGVPPAEAVSSNKTEGMFGEPTRIGAGGSIGSENEGIRNRSSKAIFQQSRTELFTLSRPTSSSSDTTDSVDADLVLRHHKKLQEDLSDDLVRMAATLKGNAEAFGELLKKDAKVLNEAEETLSTNVTRIQSEQSRLSALSLRKRGTFCLVLGVVLFVIVAFIWTFGFMRMFGVKRR